MKQVILLMTDSTRKDMLGCYGNQDMRTPFLDRLSEKGIRYENCYCCQPVCGPSRSAIFTGRYPHTNGMVTNSVALRSGVKTIGEYLTKKHISTAYIGKWHLDGGDYFGNGVCPEGYDPIWWYDMRNYLDELSPAEREFSRQSESCYDEELTEEFCFAHKCADKAIAYIGDNADKDFFLTVSLDEPHGPFLCPSPYNHMYDGYKMPDSPEYGDDLTGKPLFQQLWSGEKRFQSPEEKREVGPMGALFLGCNSYADYELGRIIDAAEEKLKDSVILYTSDHGEMLGAHSLFSKNACAYEEITNVPFLVSGNNIARGVSRQLVSHINIAPTILEYFDIDIPKTFEGRSILEQWRNPDALINENVFIEFTRYEVDHDGFGGLQMMRSIVSDEFKLVVNLLDSDEFYDLKTDPHESTNLILDEKYAVHRNRLHDLLLKHMNDTRDMYRGYQWAVRSWRDDLLPRWENDGMTRQKESEDGEVIQLDYDTGLPMEGSIRRKKI